MTQQRCIDQADRERAGPDPLGILSSCAVVVNEALQVTIDPAAVARLAADVVSRQLPAPAWDNSIHYQGEGPDATEQTIGWIFALDALNFCFWGQGPDPSHRWRIASAGTVCDGYMALAIALRDAARTGIPIWDPAWLATVDEEAIADIFRPVPGSAPIPLMSARAANLRELGQTMQSLPLGNRPFTAFVARAKGSAPQLVRAVTETFPSFRDVAGWTPPKDQGPAIAVRFYKRAQILVSDLAGAFEPSGEVTFHDLGQLTAFADYKVPQVLRHHGILRYGAELASSIRARAYILPGSPEEVEIRAATIWACELIRQGLVDRDQAFTASDVDWLLWNLGQALPPDNEPYHRTLTIFY